MSRVETKSERAQFEQFVALKALAMPRDEISPLLVQEGLRSDSWLIRSITYRLLEEIYSHPYNSSLTRMYLSAKDEYDKLLIADAMSSPLPDEAIQSFRADIKGNAPLRLKVYLAKALSAEDAVAVANWILEEHRELDKVVLTSIIHFYADRLSHASHHPEADKLSQPSVDFFNILVQADNSEVVELLGDEYILSKLAEDSVRILNAQQLRATGEGVDSRNLWISEKSERARINLEKMFLENERLQVRYREIKGGVAREDYVQNVSERVTAAVILTRIPTISENILGEIIIQLKEKDLSEDEIGSYASQIREGIEEFLDHFRNSRE